MEGLVGQTTNWWLEIVLQHGTWIIPSLLLLVGILYVLLPASGRHPPGPTPWPILGSYPKMASVGKDKAHTFFQMIHETYGAVAMIHFGSYQCVLVSGYDAIREAFVRQRDSTIGRPEELPGPKDTAHAETGLFYANGPGWTARRRAVVSGVVACMETPAHQAVVQEETQLLIQDFLAHGATPFQPRSRIRLMNMACILSALLGKRYKHTDPVFQTILTDTNVIVSKSGTYSPFGTIRMLRYIPWINRAYKQSLRAHTNLHSALQSEVEKIKKERPIGVVKSVVDAFLREQRASPESMLDENIVISMDESMNAGLDTASFTLDWALLYIADNPSVQRACQQEIDRVCGMTLSIQLSHLVNLPYVSATLYEAQRMSSVIPFSLFHTAGTDMTLNDFHIPNGTLLLYNIASSHNDEEQWTEPHTFNPDRFLNSAGKLLAILPPAFMPLGLGARKCAGYSLVQRQLILILAGLLQSLDFHNNGTPNYEGTFKMAKHPTENFITVSKRKSL